MIGPPDEKEEATVDFIRASRRQRVFKRWVEELINLLCDYFWCVRCIFGRVRFVLELAQDLLSFGQYLFEDA